MSMNPHKKCEEAYDELLNRYNNLKAIKVEETKYYITALNLSGQREQLENKAFELIQEKGILKALQYSREVDK